MPGEEITREQLFDLERKMEEKLSDISLKLEQLTNAINNKNNEFLSIADARYRKQENMVNDAKEVLDRPDIRERCAEIVRQSLNQPETKVQLKSIYGEFLCDGRDSITKWINFVKLIAGAAVIGSLLYGGNSVLRSNLTTQRAVIELLNRGE